MMYCEISKEMSSLYFGLDVFCQYEAIVPDQEAKYVERWPNTTSAWAGLSRFDIPVNRYGGVHSLLICTSSPLGFPTCHWAGQKDNTYCAKYQKADRASTLWSQSLSSVKCTVSNSRTVASNGQNTASPKYNEDISLLILQYLSLGLTKNKGFGKG